jgi:hypothetical protein
MAESLLALLKGPVFKFSIAMAFLGILRLVFLHTRLIVIAFYNSWKKCKAPGKLIRELLKLTLPTVHIRLKINPKNIYLLILYIIVFILPFFVLNHLAIIERSFGIRLMAFSKSMTYVLIIIALHLIFLRVWFLFKTKDVTVNHAGEIGFWLLIFLIFVTGFLSSRLNQPSLLVFTRIIHVAAGDLLIFLIPFTRIAYYLVLPLPKITSQLGIWLFPNTPKRNETAVYFRRIMENK